MSRLAVVVSMSAIAVGVALGCAHVTSNSTPAGRARTAAGDIERHAAAIVSEGRSIFRPDTFGDEYYWGDTLELHLAIAGSKNGGVGPGLSPKQALEAGLKLDEDQLDHATIEAIHTGTGLDDPKTTLALLKADAIVGVKAFYTNTGTQPARIGITCAFCHSTVDDAFSKGIGHRLDGWPNRDLNVGAIVAMAPKLTPFEQALQLDADAIRKVLKSWGPGKYDAVLIQDGKAFRPDGKPAATLIPAAFGLAGINLHTYTGWGSITHWNAYVAVTQMHGQGTFYDPRLNDAAKYPVAQRTHFYDVRPSTDLVTSKLGPLQEYQLSLAAPTPPEESFDQAAANRGRELFTGKATCGRCHVEPLFVEPGWPMHTAAEIGIDDFQAKRSPDDRYRTTPLRGLFARAKGGFYHDGRFATLDDVVEHYNNHFKLGLSAEQKRDLVEYLKSL
jgi:hypothetical protein